MTAPIHLITTDDIEIDISVRIGRLRMTVAELSALRETDVITLKEKADDGVDICVGEHIVARGELVASDSEDGRLMLRILEAAEAR